MTVFFQIDIPSLASGLCRLAHWGPSLPAVDTESLPSTSTSTSCCCHYPCGGQSLLPPLGDLLCRCATCACHHPLHPAGPAQSAVCQQEQAISYFHTDNQTHPHSRPSHKGPWLKPRHHLAKHETMVFSSTLTVKQHPGLLYHYPGMTTPGCCLTSTTSPHNVREGVERMWVCV